MGSQNPTNHWYQNTIITCVRVVNKVFLYWYKQQVTTFALTSVTSSTHCLLVPLGPYLGIVRQSKLMSGTRVTSSS
jgi:hypothetical protein